MTTLKVKKTVSTKKTPTKSLDVYILIDASGSMSPYVTNVTNLIDDQLKTFKKNNKNIKTTVSILSFNDKVDWLCTSEPVTSVKMEGKYVPAGSTNLNKAIYDVIDSAGTAPSKASLMLIITDGENNVHTTSNHTVKELIKEGIASDMWTVSIACPPGHKDYIKDTYAIPEGCITEWAGNKQSIKNLSAQITIGTTSLYSNITKGINNNSTYFQPDLNIQVKDIKNALDNVTSQYDVVNVPNHKPHSPRLVISTFCNSKGYKYSAGIAYYQLTKKEKVQDYKNIIIQNKDTGRLYTGDDVRDLLGIPSGGEITLAAANSAKYNVFIRSTSYTRKLVPNTLLLVKN